MRTLVKLNKAEGKRPGRAGPKAQVWRWSKIKTERSIMKIPQVKEAAVVAIAGAPITFMIGGKELPSSDSILAYCHRRLHPTLIPRFIVFPDDFPRTFIGKVLRRELAKCYEQSHPN
jgi:acyl-coenzyme A synthetase/AMP-(fatty) acid ligase